MKMIIENIIGLISTIWNLLNEMSPYLLLGFFIAGILYILIPKELIYKHFTKNNLSGVSKASLFGVPLPLCSCGVIPVAAYLKKEGASKASTLAFLSSTPTTGIDSIMATYALLGPLFAIIRPIAAFFSGILSGLFQSIVENHEAKIESGIPSCTICEKITPHTHKMGEKLKKIFHYGLFELLKETWKWLAIGIVLGGMISFFIPSAVIEKYFSQSMVSYPLMFMISIPLYVCATGSIPIVAALLLKGMTPGAGFIFLFAGPATNTATLTFVAGKLGKKSLIIYLTTIIITGLLFGLMIDYIWYYSGKDINLISGNMTMLPHWLKILSSLVLIILIINVLIPRKEETLGGKVTRLKVGDMSCSHCAKTIDASLRRLPDVRDVKINLKKKEVAIKGNILKEQAIQAIKEAGYSIT
jgi:uncharacterized membrane protein YraQ (UPF0718 family)/copper chaperone CopZ